MVRTGVRTGGGLYRDGESKDGLSGFRRGEDGGM